MSPEHFFSPFWIWQLYQFSAVWGRLEIDFYVGNILINFQRRGSPLCQIRSFSNLTALLDVNDHPLFRRAGGGAWVGGLPGTPVCLLSQEAKHKDAAWNLPSTVVLSGGPCCFPRGAMAEEAFPEPWDGRGTFLLYRTSHLHVTGVTYLGPSKAASLRNW